MIPGKNVRGCHSSYPLTALAIVVLILASCTPRLTETPLAWRLGDTGQIPEGYNTYTLFLNTSTEYPDQSAPDKLRKLERHFKGFGDSIGENNLAVWVNDPGSNALSISRGKYYADLFSHWSGKSIEYTNGPFIIVSNRHPNDLVRERNAVTDQEEPLVVVISFNNVSSARIIEVLNYLDARIRRRELDAIRTNMHVFWVTVKSQWDQADHEFLKNVTLAILPLAAKRILR